MFKPLDTGVHVQTLTGKWQMQHEMGDRVTFYDVAVCYLRDKQQSKLFSVFYFPQLRSGPLSNVSHILPQCDHCLSKSAKLLRSNILSQSIVHWWTITDWYVSIHDDALNRHRTSCSDVLMYLVSLNAACKLVIPAVHTYDQGHT